MYVCNFDPNLSMLSPYSLLRLAGVLQTVNKPNKAGLLPHLLLPAGNGADATMLRDLLRPHEANEYRDLVPSGRG